MKNLTEIHVGFTSLSKEYQQAIRLAQQSHDIVITPILPQLAGGHTGAVVYRVSIKLVDSNDLIHCVMKIIYHDPIRADALNEYGRHQLALELASKEFRTAHMVISPFLPVEAPEHLIIMFYTIAGESFNQFRPMTSFSSRKELEIIFSTLSYDLLSEWNNKIEFVQGAQPYEILESWLGYRTTPEGNIESFLSSYYQLSVQNSAFIIGQDCLLPNPLAYIRNTSWWANKTLDVIKGFSHNDLNTNNVLVHFLRDSSELAAYVLIDFALFESAQYLFYDHLYLEVSQFIDDVPSETLYHWIELLTKLASNEQIDSALVPIRLSGAYEARLAGRRTFDRWIQEHYSSLYDDIWGQYLLAAIGAGLNFCNKRNLSKEQRIIAFLYAAAHLKLFLNNFQIPLRNENITTLKLDNVTLFEPQTATEWLDFYESCNRFLSNQVYILVAGPIARKQHNSVLQAIGRVGWSLVLDFDPNTEVEGLYKLVELEIRKRRSLHLITIKEQDEFLPKNVQQAAYWYAARGLAGRYGTTPEDSERAWERQYGRKLDEFLLVLAKSSHGLPVKVVFIWDNEPMRSVLCRLLDNVFFDRVQFIFATTSPDNISESTKVYNPKIALLDIHQVAVGFLRQLPAINDGEEDVWLPSRGGMPVLFPIKEKRVVEEDLILLDLNIGVNQIKEHETISELHDQNSDYPKQGFLWGNKITWFELANDQDVKHSSIVEKLKEQIETDLEGRDVRRIQLYHYPGAGGTTVARRIGWDLHQKYPTVFLKQITSATVEKLAIIHRYTDQPILVVIDDAGDKEDMIISLYKLIQSEILRGIVLLLVERRNHALSEKQSSSQRIFYLPAELSSEQAYYFAQAYGKQAPDRQKELNDLATLDRLRYMRMPFYFGLVAFEGKFTYLEEYVHRALRNVTDKQRYILCYLAISHWYSQHGVPAQLFSAVVGTQPSQNVNLEIVLSREHLDLLVKEIDNEILVWRPVHSLIAQEIMIQILSGSADRSAEWKNQLAEWAIRLIQDFSSSNAVDNVISFDTTDLMRSLFIIRRTQDLLVHDRFANLLQDIPEQKQGWVNYSSGRAAVLKQLVDKYPEEAHFHAHYARLLSYQKDYINALVEADRAVHLKPDDSIIWHVKGMVITRKLYGLFSNLEKKSLSSHTLSQDKELKEIPTLIQLAGNTFLQARILQPESEHGYISHIQLLIKAIEFGYRLYANKNSEKKYYKDFLLDDKNEYYINMVEQAEALLAELKEITIEQTSNILLELVEGSLDEFYEENYTALLTRWRQMLDYENADRPAIRRRLVRTHLARHARFWDELSLNELDSIAKLMDKNLENDPSNERDLRTWFEAVRRLPYANLDLAINKLAQWYSRTEALEAVYYLAILHFLKAIDGSALSVEYSRKYLEECNTRTTRRSNRITSYNWMGKGEGMARIIYFKKLAPNASGIFFEAQTHPLLIRQRGKITSAERPEAGKIELDIGLTAFFVPGQRRVSDNQPFISSDVNRDVEFYLGFSYSGLRAWKVDLIT